MKKLLGAVVGVFLCLVSLSWADFQCATEFDQLDRNFWLVFDHGGHDLSSFPPAYEKATVVNGVLRLPVNETDHGPELITKGIRISPQSVITVEWKARVHYGNEYFAGAVHFALSDYPSFYAQEGNYSINPLHTSSNQYKALGIVYYRNYVYNNYDPPAGGNSFGLCGYNRNCLLSQPVWDQWFTNKVEINLPEGKIKFWQDGNYIGEVPINPSLDFSQTPYLKILFSPYGWWTGHFMELDSFSITVKAITVKDSGSQGECESSFDSATGILNLPAVLVGDILFTTRLQLVSSFPHIIFKVLSIDPSHCNQATTCPSEFNSETNFLNIPLVLVDGRPYWARLSLISSFPDIRFKVEEVGEGGSCNSNTCEDCGCPDYATHHPQECGQTGALTFRALWYDQNDLDLRVLYIKDGQTQEIIDFNNPLGSLTGGQLDRDSNSYCVDVSNSPVENIYFSNPPSGTYRVEICSYKQCVLLRPISRVKVQVFRNNQLVKEKEINLSVSSQNCLLVFEEHIP